MYEIYGASGVSVGQALHLTDRDIVRGHRIPR